ncbi:hypothetical protein [Sinorhizobium meliloti]
MSQSVPIDTREITVTPVFQYISIEDVPASEREGRPVMKQIQAVEVRFAGSKLYSPVFPVDAFWKRDGHRTITYAERWPEQYRAFLEGNSQEAAGTPLEMLKAYGISDSHLSLCRALKVYSIEALHHLEGSNLKNLGMAANDLKRMASAYMADRSKGSATAEEVERLKKEVEALRGMLAVPPKEPTPQEIEEAIAASDKDYEAMSDEALKDIIREKTGMLPKGNYGHASLVSMAKELDAA